MQNTNHNFKQSDQRFEPGTPIKQYAILKSGERVFVDRQDGDGQQAWFYAGKRQIDPADVDGWQ